MRSHNHIDLRFLASRITLARLVLHDALRSLRKTRHIGRLTCSLCCSGVRGAERVGVRACLEDLGLPAARVRTYGIALNRETLVWLGPTDELSIKAAFMSFWGRVTMLDGDIYVGVDGEESRREFIEYLARNRGMYNVAPDIKLDALMPPGTRERLHHLQEIFRTGARTGAAGACLADVSQSSNRSRMGPWLPAVTRSAQYVSLSKGVPLTPDEVNFAMGWPVASCKESAEYLHCCPPSWSKLSVAAKRRLSGNGMMLQQVMAWALFVLSHTARRSTLQALMMPISIPSKRRAAPIAGNEVCDAEAPEHAKVAKVAEGPEQTQ